MSPAASTVATPWPVVEVVVGRVVWCVVAVLDGPWASGGSFEPLQAANTKTDANRRAVRRMVGILSC